MISRSWSSASIVASTDSSLRRSCLRSSGASASSRAERLAYYDARKLNYLPYSLFDYDDVIHRFVAFWRFCDGDAPARPRGAQRRSNALRKKA